MDIQIRQIVKTKDDIARAREILLVIEQELEGLKDKVVVGSEIKVAGIRDIYYKVSEKGSNHVVIDVGGTNMKVAMSNIIKIK